MPQNGCINFCIAFTILIYILIILLLSGSIQYSGTSIFIIRPFQKFLYCFLGLGTLLWPIVLTTKNVTPYDRAGDLFNADQFRSAAPSEYVKDSVQLQYIKININYSSLLPFLIYTEFGHFTVIVNVWRRIVTFFSTEFIKLTYSGWIFIWH